MGYLGDSVPSVQIQRKDCWVHKTGPFSTITNYGQIVSQVTVALYCSLCIFGLLGHSLLRNILHTERCTHLKCTIQQFFMYLQNCATITSLYIHVSVFINKYAKEICSTADVSCPGYPWKLPRMSYFVEMSLS